MKVAMRNKEFNRDAPFNALPDLPPVVNLETPEIFKATIRANKLLAELKGFCQTLPNPELLLNTIVLQESKESSAIENIVTTQDELYKATLMGDKVKNQAAKEVLQYRQAMYFGLEELEKKGIITTNLLVGIMQRLRNRLLREVTEENNWTEWVLYVVNGIAETSANTLEKIKRILSLKREAAVDLKSKMGTSFSLELNDLLFSYPYIKISVLEERGIAKRQTASQYLQKIENMGWLESFKVGRDTYYINQRLIQILSQ